MIQGTSSSAGKSTLVTGLCRLYRDRGYSVAPFKSQNMALNASVTADGREIGRSQAVQAEAARIAPDVDMNPILLKPESDKRSQVVLMGEAMDSVQFGTYHERKLELRLLIEACLGRLREKHDLVIIEGAGSPAEINLRDRDIVNMFVAHAADAPVLLVGDIDRGGVFASFVGTIELMDRADRERIKGFVVNRFRGDVELLRPGLDMLEDKTGLPTFGVVPYLKRLRIADEDSLDLAGRTSRKAAADELDIAIIRLRRISNFDDFMSLENEPGVNVRYVEEASEFEGADLVVIPGTKSTISDLQDLRDNGMAAAIIERARKGQPILGVCGGCQMLGREVRDPEGFESDGASVAGLGLLPIATRFEPRKKTVQVSATPVTSSFLTGSPSAISAADGSRMTDLSGYEIHAGEVLRETETRPAFRILRRGDSQECLDGAVAGSVVGTMIHGILENDELRRSLLTKLRSVRGLAEPAVSLETEDPYDRLAGELSESLDMDRLDQLVFGAKR